LFVIVEIALMILYCKRNSFCELVNPDPRYSIVSRMIKRIEGEDEK